MTPISVQLYSLREASEQDFDAVLSAYTAFLWARDGWEMPADQHDVFEEDGWIWTPPAE